MGRGKGRMISGMGMEKVYRLVGREGKEEKLVGRGGTVRQIWGRICRRIGCKIKEN